MALTLMDALNEGVDAEDSWCDICEQRRGPKVPAYHSSEPPFTVAVDCILPQIVRALQGHQGEVEVRRCSDGNEGVVLVSTQSSTDGDAARAIANKRTKAHAAKAANRDYVTLTQAQVMVSVTWEEKERVRRIFDKIDKLSIKAGDHTYFKFSDKAFEQFKVHVYIPSDIKSGYIYAHMGDNPVYVQVGSDFVAPELVPLYRQLIDRHGDFTANSPLSPGARAPILLLTMKSIQAMLARRLFHTIGYELCTWQRCFELVRDEVGFEVQFALDYSEKVARYLYAINVIMFRDKITKDLSEQIGRLSKDIHEDQPKVESLKGQHKTAIQGSVFGKQCSFKTSKLQWKSAGEFLGLDPEEES